MSWDDKLVNLVLATSLSTLILWVQFKISGFWSVKQKYSPANCTHINEASKRPSSSIERQTTSSISAKRACDTHLCKLIYWYQSRECLILAYTIRLWTAFIVTKCFFFLKMKIRYSHNIYLFLFYQQKFVCLHLFSAMKMNGCIWFLLFNSLVLLVSFFFQLYENSITDCLGNWCGLYFSERHHLIIAHCYISPALTSAYGR